MLYLLNSAFRPKYLTNILNTFFLESGCVNEYRYSQVNVDPQITNASSPLSDKQGIMVFIDRFHAGSFYFHPIRLLTCLEHESRADQVYFRCKLGDFVYPIDVDDFQKTLLSTLGNKGLPRLPALGPDSPAEGCFALLGQNVLVDSQYRHGEEAWVQSAENIAKTNVFAGKSVIFLRESIRTEGKKEHFVTPRLSGNTFYYPLRRGKRYTLQLYYRFPIQDANHGAKTKFSVQTPDLVSALGSTEVIVNSRNSTEYLNFSVKRFPEERQGVLSLGAGAPGLGNGAAAESALLPEAAITVRITESLLFWPLVLLLLLCYSLLGLVTGTDFDKLLTPLETAKQLTALQGVEKTVLGFCQDYWLLLKAAASFCQAIALLVLFGMLGKKIS
jgi:hypothetical protein